MHIITDLPTLRTRINEWTRAGQRIGFVPTMGNLHAGHESLVQLARKHAARVVVSIFVNPTQFGPNEDFGRYPRTPEADHARLRALGVDLVWQPSVDTMYPFGQNRAVQIHVPGLTDILEGAHRPGHFDGVASVVTRLFQQVKPDLAVFGRKDYQQLAVIRALVQDLSIPVELIPAPTIRDADGLALSSRNQYLSAIEREHAPELYQSLTTLRDAVLAGEPPDSASAHARARLAASGFVVDYVEVRTSTLDHVIPATRNGALVALAAAALGHTRLIDNLEWSLPAPPVPVHAAPRNNAAG